MRTFYLLLKVALLGLMYLFGLYLIVGDLNLVSQDLGAFETVFSTHQDQSIALAVLALATLILFSLLHQVFRLAYWLGAILLLSSLVMSILLVSDVISFPHPQLLTISSALISTLFVTLFTLSLVAVMSVRDFRLRQNSTTTLHKLLVREPETLLFKTTMQAQSIFVAPIFLISYSSFTFFYLKHEDISLGQYFDALTYTFVFIVALLLYVWSLVRSAVRMFQ